MEKMSNTLWGLVLIIVGLIFGLNALDITNINVFFDGWWTLLIIVPCFIDLFRVGDKTGSIVGLIIGISLLLGCQDLLDFKLIWKLMIPFSLVAIGLSIILKDTFYSMMKKKNEKQNKKNSKEYTATFSSQNLDFSNETFEGCDLSAVFGGMNCNLKDASMQNDVVINISSIFGGITLYVPNDVNVKIASSSVFGGVSDHRKKKNKEADVTIYVNATCLFGGVEIK
ncbi:MAG: LiaF-related protein [bacterium]|nr:LiaF-related protein [bacterium]